MRTLSILVLAASLSPAASAQPNLRPGTDVSLGGLGDISGLAHVGTFPNGRMALAMETTSCNLGTVNVPWKKAMNADHPFIAFLIARETGDRMVQISDRSFIKHGFFALSQNACTPCQNPSNGTFLGVGCSDVYGIGNNGDDFWLAPADEVDPWTGAWQPVCSHFDKGEPPLAAPLDCDGQKSPINPASPLGNRVRVDDADLNSPGSNFYFQGMYVVIGEAEADRGNNIGSRRFTANWTGGGWNLQVPSVASGNVLKQGSILRQWSGASLASASNGDDDGRIYVAVKTIDLGNGFHRYEYAVHNRDNERAVGTFRIPVCPGATVQNVGFHDVDPDVGNDWSFSQTATEIVFSTTGNPIRWNTFYNFWFECSAAPLANNTLVLGQHDPGPGADWLAVTSTAPLRSNTGPVIGQGTIGSNGFVPQLRGCGQLGSGQQADVVLRLAEPNAPAFLVAGLQNNPAQLFDGTLYPNPVLVVVGVHTNPDGEFVFPVPGGGGLVDVYTQYLVSDAGTPFGYSFSNAHVFHFTP